MKIRFLSVAEREYQDAYDYYEEAVEGLGIQFGQEVIAALKRIENFPDAWQKISRKTRRCRLERFPYGLVYQKRTDELLVVAVMHLAKQPAYWVKRS